VPALYPNKCNGESICPCQSCGNEIVQERAGRDAILSLAGMIVSSISLQRHYAKSATSYCEFGENSTATSSIAANIRA